MKALTHTLSTHSQEEDTMPFTFTRTNLPIPVGIPFSLSVLEYLVIFLFLVDVQQTFGEDIVRGQTTAGRTHTDRDELIQTTITGRHMVYSESGEMCAQ